MIIYTLGIICAIAIVTIVFLLGWLKAMAEDLEECKSENRSLKKKLKEANKK